MSRCPTCDAKKPEHKVLCWKCWALLPADQQGQVLGLWKTTLRGANPSIRRLAIQEYKQAREAAIAAVKAKLGKGFTNDRTHGRP